VYQTCRQVDVFIGKLRNKLKHASPEWEYLHTHFGIGYRFAAQHREQTCSSPAVSGRAADSRTAKTPQSPPEVSRWLGSSDREREGLARERPVSGGSWFFQIPNTSTTSKACPHAETVAKYCHKGRPVERER
jgi:hypothetical protein